MFGDLNTRRVTSYTNFKTLNLDMAVTDTALHLFRKDFDNNIAVVKLNQNFGEGTSSDVISVISLETKNNGNIYQIYGGNVAATEVSPNLDGIAACATYMESISYTKKFNFWSVSVDSNT